jgi:hypothetical protein
VYQKTSVPTKTGDLSFSEEARWLRAREEDENEPGALMPGRLRKEEREEGS